MEILLILILTTLLFVLKKLFRLPFTSPPVIMSVVWASFIYVGLLFLRDYQWQYLGLIWIFISCIVFLFGFVLGDGVSRKRWKNTVHRKVATINKLWLRKILMISVAIGLTYGFVKLQGFGVSFSDMFSLEGLGEINNEVAVARYSGTGTYSLLLQFLLSFVYLSPLLGGLLFSLAEGRRDKAIALSAFLPEILAFSFSNEKATLIVCIFLWAAAYLSGYIRRYGRYPKLAFVWILKTAILVFGLVAILVISMMLRIGGINGENFDTAVQKVSNSYALSHISAFDDYFVRNSNQQYSYGVITFYGISNFIGLSERGQGIYEDSFSSGELGTNVFTPFRGIIQDFGIIGGLVFQFVIAFVAGICVYRIRFCARNPYMSMVYLISIYTFILFTYVSIFSYLSIIAALILLVIILALNPLIIQHPKKDG